MCIRDRAAFGPAARDELDGHVARYARNRDLLLRRLPELGITRFAPPDGAFYAWCDVRHLTDDSQRWCAEVLDATGVALAPGLDFDPVAGHRMMRLSFCGETAELQEALDRLIAYVNRGVSAPPVSYTHLDVYKRQESGATPDQAGDCRPAAVGLCLPWTISPNATWAQQRLSPIRCWRLSATPRSTT